VRDVAQQPGDHTRADEVGAGQHAASLESGEPEVLQQRLAAGGERRQHNYQRDDCQVLHEQDAQRDATVERLEFAAAD